MQGAKPAVEPSAQSDAARRALERRAVEAAIWGMPLVVVDALRQAFLRDAGARYNDIVYMSRPADGRFQITTPDAAARYAFIQISTKNGPVVIDVPPAAEAGLVGTIHDAWQEPVADVGPAGDDRGKGGRYVVLPPGYRGLPPDGIFAVPMRTYNGYAFLRAVPASGAPADAEQAVALVTQTRVYALGQAGTLPPQRFIDMAGTLLDGIVRFDDTFYDALARMVDEEPVQERDLVAMAQLRSIGIEKGRPFTPDPAMRELLKRAVGEARAGFIQAMRDMPRFHAGRRWTLPCAAACAEPGKTPGTLPPLDVDARAQQSFTGCAPARTQGAVFQLVALSDAHGMPLAGGRRYTLRVPADVPARHSWAVTAYDCETAAFVRGAASLEINSFTEQARRGEDGSVDVVFGPAPPPGREANWIATVPGRPFMVMFRCYGPEPALLDGTWSLPDVEVANEAAGSGPAVAARVSGR